MTHVISLPVLQCRLFGYPGLIRLTAREHKAMALIHLGGLGALRAGPNRIACRTIDSLVRKALLGRDGLTDLGKLVAESAADSEHTSAVS